MVHYCARVSQARLANYNDDLDRPSQRGNASISSRGRGDPQRDSTDAYNGERLAGANPVTSQIVTGANPAVPRIPANQTRRADNRALRPKSAKEFRSHVPASARIFRPHSASTSLRHRPLSANTTAMRNGCADARRRALSPRMQRDPARIPVGNTGSDAHTASRKENEIQQQFDLELGRIKDRIEKERTVTTDFVDTINDCAQHFYHSNSCAPWRHV